MSNLLTVELTDVACIWFHCISCADSSAMSRRCHHVLWWLSEWPMCCVVVWRRKAGSCWLSTAALSSTMSSFETTSSWLVRRDWLGAVLLNRFFLRSLVLGVLFIWVLLDCFLPRDAMLVLYVLCACVCLSHVGVLLKWLNTGTHY